MLSHVQRINEWDEWILIDDNTATSFIAEWEKVLSSLLQNAVVGRFFITNELFPGNYKGISRREETATKEKRKEEMSWADFRLWFQGALPDPPGSESLFSSAPGHPVKGTPSALLFISRDVVSALGRNENLVWVFILSLITTCTCSIPLEFSGSEMH